MTKPPVPTAFQKQAKAIKRFVSFSVADKTIKPKSLAAKVRRYYHLIYGKAGEPGIYNPATDVPMRPRGKAFAAVRDSEGQPAHRSIKVVFVETVADPIHPEKLLKPRFKYKNGKVIKSNFDVSQTFFPFRIKISLRRGIEEALERDCRRIFAEAPTVRTWLVKCGRRQTENPLTREEVITEVVSFLNRYHDTVNDWLAGLIAFEYLTTASRDSFMAEREKLRKGKSGRKASRRNRR